jgi:hypothetical protein
LSKVDKIHGFQVSQGFFRQTLAGIIENSRVSRKKRRRLPATFKGLIGKLVVRHRPLQGGDLRFGSDPEIAQLMRVVFRALKDEKPLAGRNNVAGS